MEGKRLFADLASVEGKRLFMEKKCEEALAQIEEQKYAVPLEDDGYQEILKYAVCFFKKGCMVRN